jgi:tetratricopeptide (TPR) repeat protein
LDALTQEAGGDPGLQNELAAAYQKLGDVQGGGNQANLGDRDGAIRSYRKALAILESLKPAPAEKALLLDMAGLHGKLHQALWRIGQQAEAEEHLHRGLSMREQLVTAEPDNVSYRLGLARGYRDFGGLLASKTKKDGDGAIAYYRKSNELCESIIAGDPANLEARAIAGLGYRMLGGEFEVNDPPQAGEYYRKALALTQEREKLDPNNAQIQLVLADCYSNIGRALMLQRDEAGALENFHRALTVFAGRFAKDPNNALALMNLSQTYNNLGNVLAQSGKFTGALENYQLALGLREPYLKAHPNEAGFKPRLGETTFDLGDLYAQMASDGRTPASKQLALWQEAKSWYQRSSAIWQELSKDGTLPGYQSQKPEEASKALARCDAALAEIARK